MARYRRAITHLLETHRRRLAPFATQRVNGFTAVFAPQICAATSQRQQRNWLDRLDRRSRYHRSNFAAMSGNYRGSACHRRSKYGRQLLARFFGAFRDSFAGCFHDEYCTDCTENCQASLTIKMLIASQSCSLSDCDKRGRIIFVPRQYFANFF